MTARKTKSEQDEKTAETQKAGKDESKTLQTTDEARENEEKVPTTPQDRGETDANADGSKVGAVVDGDTGLDSDDDDEKFDAVEGEEVTAPVGVVAERNAEGDEFDVPFVYLTAQDVARTSDSDDPAKDWTAQHAGGERQDEDGNDLDPVALTEVVGTPGQTFRVRELPNREVAEAAGINYEQWVAGLPVRADVPGEAPRRGTPA